MVLVLMSEEKNIKTDYDYSRQTYYDLIEKGREGLEDMMEVARSSEHPRAYEVLSGMIKNISDVNDVLRISSKLLIIAGVFQLFDGIQAVVLGALRGMQDVNKPALIIFLSYGLIGFPTSYFLGFYTNLSVIGIWIGLMTGLFSSSLFCSLLLLSLA